MSNRGGFIEFLTADQVQEIHLATLRLMENAGIHVPQERCLTLLAEAGAKVDMEKEMAYFPPWLVEKMVALAPSSFLWHGRDPKKDLQVGGKITHYGTGSSAMTTVGIDCVRRLSTIEDAHNFSRLADALDNVDEGYCVVHPNDVMEAAHHAHMMYAMFKNTSKPFKGRNTGTEEAEDCVAMAEIVAGGREAMQRRPNLMTNVSTVTPLAHARDMLEGMMVYVAAGLPVIFTPEVQTGATGPSTLAGSLVIHNAEVLSGIVIAQLVRAGAPVVYGNVSSSFDMRYAMLPYATPEAWLLNSATAQLSRYYGVPCRGTGGFVDSNCLDMQAGYEAGMSLLMGTLSGLNFIIGCMGEVENALGADYRKAVIDNEIIGVIGRITRGFQIDAENLALDLIEEVGPLGQFLMSKHTKKHFREATFLPDLKNCLKYDLWEQAGSRRIEDVALERAKDILATHEPLPLPDDIDKELQKYVAFVEKRERK